MNLLGEAVDTARLQFKSKVDSKTATAIEVAEYELLRYSMSKGFILYILGASAEEIVSAKVHDLFGWKAKTGEMKADNQNLHKAWLLAINAVVPLLTECTKAKQAYDVVRSWEDTKAAAESVRRLLKSFESTLASEFAILRDRTEW